MTSPLFKAISQVCTANHLEMEQVSEPWKEILYKGVISSVTKMIVNIENKSLKVAWTNFVKHEIQVSRATK